jgi:tRNA-2-methylthio-N6-dimethylallyladenosine synthase
MKYYILTYGCQMNLADSEKIAATLEKNSKMKLAKSLKEANFVVINMCSVRQSAVDRVMGLKDKLKNKKVMITGCILKKDKLKLEKRLGKVVEINEFTRQSKEKSSNNLVAYVPIMTGCNNFCSYCVVPYTRGREISRPQKEIICKIKKLIKNGSKEIWLLGQNVNSYKYGFAKLLRAVNKIKGDFSIRFMSSHPKDFSNDLIKAMAECKKVAKYLNLPVQSGSNEILKKMNRPYGIEQYKNLVRKIRKEIPNINLSTDVIVGFPGETKEQFEDTVRLFKEIKYNIAYINKYSPRSGTASFKLKDNIPSKEKICREQTLKKIIKETNYEK